jgi:isomerase DpgB
VVTAAKHDDTAAAQNDTAAEQNDTVLRIDGRLPISAATTEAVLRLCDRAEDRSETGLLVAYVSGAPGEGWTGDLSVGLLTKWERALRRLERLGLATVAVAAGDCGGTALDVLLATDIRIAEPGVRLLLPVDAEATWPGMSLYRLARQGGVRGVRRAALLGTPIEAADAVALGLLDTVVGEPGATLAELTARAGTITGKELAIRRQLMQDADRTSFEEALGSHLAACDRALRRAAKA